MRYKTVWLLLLLMMLGAPAVAKVAFEESNHYVEIFPAYPGSEQGKIEVVEFFWYNCPHCFDFEPHLQGWLETKADDVHFVRVPAIFNDKAKMHAETFYALELMGLINSMHSKIFETIHDQKRRLDSLDAMAAFLTEQGIDEQKFRNTVKSFAVQTRVNRAASLAKRFSITGVPNVVVNGAYKSSNTQSYEQMIELIDYLINKSREQGPITAAQ